MAVENNVYLAKLAEQAERYEGNTPSPQIAESYADALSYRDGRVHEECGISRSGAIR